MNQVKREKCGDFRSSFERAHEQGKRGCGGKMGEITLNGEKGIRRFWLLTSVCTCGKTLRWRNWRESKSGCRDHAFFLPTKAKNEMSGE
jgi:hypothetical protein